MIQISRYQARPPSLQLRTNIVTPPSVEPVSIQDYLNYLRIDTAKNEQTIQGKLIAARGLLEPWTRRCFVNTVFDAFLDIPIGIGALAGWSWAPFFGFMPESSIEIPYAPLIAPSAGADSGGNQLGSGVQGVYVTDNTGTETKVAPTFYWVTRAQDPGRLALRIDQDWPSTGSRSFETFRFRFVAGYVTPFTATLNSPILNAANHCLYPGQTTILENRDGTLPAPLAEGVTYYVVSATQNSLVLDTTPTGPGITITNVGSGVQFLGKMPSALRRAILAAAAYDHTTTEKKFRAVRGIDQADVSGIPELARNLAQPFRQLNF